MKRCGPILILSVLILLTLILTPTSMILDGKIASSIHRGDVDQIAEFNKTILEQSIVDAIELKDDVKVSGNVSFNETEIDFDIYHVEFEKGWSFFNFHREISLSRESEGNGTIYLDIYGIDLEKVVSHETLITENKSNNWTNFDQEDIDGNEMFFVIYGNGNYTLTTEQHLKYEQSAIMFSFNVIVFSIIILLFMFIAVITYYFQLKKIKQSSMNNNNNNKRQILKRDTIDIKNRVKKLKLISLINYSGFLVIYILLIIMYIDYPNNMTYFFNIYFEINNNNDLFLNLFFNGFVYLIIIFVFLDLILYIHYHVEKEILIKTSIPDNYIKKKKFREKIIKEKTFQLLQILQLLLVSTIVLSLIIYFIEGFVEYAEYYCCFFIFSIFIIPLIIFSFVLVVYGSFQRIEYKKETLKFYSGPGLISGMSICGKKLEKEDIKSIRPIPASLYYDLLPGLQRRDGKFILVKTGILIEDYNGKFYRVLTSRPMEIVSLMRK